MNCYYSLSLELSLSLNALSSFRVIWPLVGQITTRFLHEIVRKRFLAIENKSYDLVCEGRVSDCLQINEDGRGFRRSIFQEKDEYRWFLDALGEFWWRKKRECGLNIW